MSGEGIERPGTKAAKDPVVRFFLGCALVSAICVALVVSVVVFVGWEMTRDPAPGRVAEGFLIGDETRYWRVDLRPDDPGLIALFTRFAELNDTKRRALLSGTVLENLPLPSRNAHLEDVAPITVELALSARDPAGAADSAVAWSGRGTFTHGVWKMRAALRMMRWLAKKETGAAPDQVDGVIITRLGPGLALATVGNRLLAASDFNRLRTVLTSPNTPAAAPDPRLFALHDALKLPGEDAWAFSTTLSAAGSFDVNDRDELAFRIGTLDGQPIDGLAAAKSFLPKVPADAFEIDAGTDPSRCTGRITGLSQRFAALIDLATDPRVKDRKKTPSEPETPSANPSLPSREPSGDPRSETPGARKRGGSPKPPR